MKKLSKGDKVKYTYSDGSFDEGVVVQPKRKDGYCGVRFGWWGIQLIKPSKLTRVQ